MRIGAYADRLLLGLDSLDWSYAIKEMQRNWIGKSIGATIYFEIKNYPEKLEVFTTRPDTIFGVTFITLAPEHHLVKKLLAQDKKAVTDYADMVAIKSDRERQVDVKSISGVFTGAFAIHPFTGVTVPIWIGEYVLADYGTGAVMAVPGETKEILILPYIMICPLSIYFRVSIYLKLLFRKKEM